MGKVTGHMLLSVSNGDHFEHRHAREAEQGIQLDVFVDLFRPAPMRAKSGKESSLWKHRKPTSLTPPLRFQLLRKPQRVQKQN
jgi:hypothetical protein